MAAVLYRFLFIVGLSLFGSSLHAQEFTPKELFSSGYALYVAGKPARAKELLEKATDPSFILADYSLHYLSLIAFDEKNWEQARQYALQLRQQYPDSVWATPADLQLAKIDLAEKKYNQVIAALRSLRANKAAKSELLQEAIFLEAQAQDSLGERQQAYALYGEVRSSYPNSRWAASARREQTNMREKFPELFALTTPQAISEEADRLVREGQHSQAEKLYKQLLAGNPDREFRLRLLDKLAALYMSMGKRNDAIPIFRQITRDYPTSPEAPKALYQTGQILWNRHDNAQAMEYFKAVLDQFPKSVYIDRAQYALADIYEYFGKKELAIQYYTRVFSQFPKSSVRGDAQWRLAWLYYRAGQWQPAFSNFGALASQTSDASLRTAALYWQARSAEKSGDLETAGQLLRRIAGGDDESYYKSLSQQRLGYAPVETKSITTSAANEPDPLTAPELNFHLSRARALIALSLRNFAVAELDEVERLSRQQVGLRPMLMREYFRSEAYARSLSIANQLPNSFEERDRFRFPLAYWNTIQRKAQERDLDPYLVLSLIRQESLFNARARSPAFALGLMQLLPSTAARMAKEIGVEAPSNERLFEPDINLTLGMKYLKDLLQRYSNNWYKAIAAYNAGESAVDRWEREIVTDDIEEFVERIPYLETRGYVKLVMRNHRIYKKLYESPTQP